MPQLNRPLLFAAALTAFAVAFGAIAAGQPEGELDTLAVEPVVSRAAAPSDALDTLDATPGVETDAPAPDAGADPLPGASPDETRAKSRAVKPSAKKRPDTLERADPPMWRVTDADSEIYFVGTFHALPRDIDWRSDALARAADMAQTVVFEAEVDTPAAQKRAQEIISRYGRNRQGVSLSSILGPDYATQFAAAARGLGIDPALLEPARPWHAFLALSIKFLMNEGFDPGAGLEQVMLTEARVRGRNLRFFETVDQQLNLFASMPADQEKALLVTTLREWDNQADDVRAMLAAWRGGDLDTIDRLMNGAMRDEAPGVYDRLIVRRNAAWADKTEQLLDGAGTVLIAVGAAHLAGADSLPAMLAARGRAVERWPAPAQERSAGGSDRP